MMRLICALGLVVGCFVLQGCGSDDPSMKPSDSIASDLKKAGPATGEVGGKGDMKKAGE